MADRLPIPPEPARRGPQGRPSPPAVPPSRNKPAGKPASRPKADYPIARPYAPPPLGSPYYKPMPRVPPAPPPPPVLPPRPSLSHYWIEGAILAVVVWVSMTLGWLFFRGPGQALFSGKKEPEAPGAAVVADASRPADPGKDKLTPSPRPVDVPPVQPAPAPTPAPASAPPPAARPAPSPAPPPAPAPTPAPRPTASAPTFAREVQPIFQSKCLKCHGEGKLRAMLDLRTIPAMLKGNSNGPALVPGQPNLSPIWETIRNNSMPPGQAKLTTAEKRIVQEWIAGGAR